jgi:hypothetical protein
MSGTPNLGAFNKDKVANKFGIQLKTKDSLTQIQRPLTPTTEKKSTITESSSIVTKSKIVSDFRKQNDSNGFQSNTNHSALLKTPEPTRKLVENSIKSKSSSELISTPINNERRTSLTPNVNHSTTSNPVKSNEPIKSLSPSSSSTNLSPLKSPEIVKRSSLTPINRSVSPEPSSIKRLSLTKSTERAISPVSSIKPPNVPTTINKTEAAIEHQKDQPLYKRQLSKTLDNATSIVNKTKHQHELPTISTTTSGG